MGDKEAAPVNPVVFFDITLGGEEASLCVVLCESVCILAHNEYQLFILLIVIRALLHFFNFYYYVHMFGLFS